MDYLPAGLLWSVIAGLEWSSFEAPFHGRELQAEDQFQYLLRCLEGRPFPREIHLYTDMTYFFPVHRNEHAPFDNAFVRFLRKCIDELSNRGINLIIMVVGTNFC